MPIQSRSTRGAAGVSRYSYRRCHNCLYWNGSGADRESECISPKMTPINIDRGCRSNAKDHKVLLTGRHFACINHIYAPDKELPG